MKKLFSLFLVVMMVMGVGFIQNVFAGDISAISDLNALEIMQGYPDGTFGEDNHITRAEMAKVILRTMGTEKIEIDINIIEREVTSYFTDVETTHWAYDYIEIASYLGIIKGNGDGTFLPDNNVTYGEVVKMIVCALGYEPMAESIGGYPQGYITTAMNMGLVRNLSGVIDDPITRGEVAELIHTALDLPIMEQRIVNDNITFVIMDGQNGVDLKTLRTERHTTTDSNIQGGSGGSSKGEIVVPAE